MEITDRDDLGAELWALQRDNAGRESWSASLLTYVQPGDRVFHWHRSIADEPAIVGWSEAVGPLSSEVKSWQAHGTRGRARGVPTQGSTWMMPLANLVMLDTPVTRSTLNDRYREIIEVLEHTASLAGGPSYAPFQNYGGRELRAQQGYLTKFPAALTDMLFPLASVASVLPETGSSPKIAQLSRGQAYMADAEKRSALERHAVELARELYVAQGATHIEELVKPYDLRVIVGGVERHIEVKGSMGADLASVLLTQGEVAHASSWQPTDLVVVDSIECWRDEAGDIRTSGGYVRQWLDWSPLEADLTPTQLRYGLTHLP